MSYWEFEDEETEMCDNHLRIYALLAEYIDYAKQINYDDIIDKPFKEELLVTLGGPINQFIIFTLDILIDIHRYESC